MIRAPDPRPPLATPTVLLLPHELQLFTSRSFVHCFLKISLQPFRYYPKASRSFKFTPFRFQITVPIFSQSSNPPALNTTRIATQETRSPLKSFNLCCWLRVIGQRSKQGRDKERWCRLKTRNRWGRRRTKEEDDGDVHCQKKKKERKKRKEKKGKGK